MKSSVHLVVFCLSFSLARAGTLHAQPEDDEFQPGLIGTYSAGDESFARLDRQIAFDWNQEKPDRRIVSSKFDVRWDGNLMSQAKGEYRLHLYLAGRATVELDGKVVIDADAAEPAWHRSEPLRLSFAFHPLKVRYSRTSDASVVKLFWSGPQFQLEPVGSRWLFHDSTAKVEDTFERGELLVRGLRCAGCHSIGGIDETLLAPSLERVAGNLHREWLVAWLADEIKVPVGTMRRMPHFELGHVEAQALAAFLIDQSKPTERIKIDKKKIDRKAGEELLLTLGCLACHQVGSLGNADLFSGGDLTNIAAKRPANFFQQWLSKPETLNRQHRMPIFDLSKEELRNLSAHLATLGKAPEKQEVLTSKAQREHGRRLFEQHRCASCHETAVDVSTVKRIALRDAKDWSESCLSATDRSRQRPVFRLAKEDRIAIEQAVAVLASIGEDSEPPKPTGRQLLAEHNCLACHQRGDSTGLAERLPQVAEAHSQLASLLPAMTPPPLIGVGDKLHEESLQQAIQRKSLYRDYLRVRMPKFRLTDEQLRTLVGHFIEADRIPDSEEEPQLATTDPLVLHSVGKRLVTTNGFGCTSCHQVGTVQPTKAPLNARGPTLSMLSKRIRRAWFDRFVRNPLRVIPRMEMPSLQVAVKGALNDDLETQLTAVWDVLNTEGFEPPLPDPVRIIRRSGIAERNERAVVVTDVIRLNKDKILKPLLIGLPNRQNFLFDLERAALVRWSLGDVANQQTEGKTWFWEVADNELGSATDGITFARGSPFSPTPKGQFLTEFDELSHINGGIRFTYRLTAGTEQIRVAESYRAVSSTVSKRIVEMSRIPSGLTVLLSVLQPGKTNNGKGQPLGRVEQSEPEGTRLGSQVQLSRDRDGMARVVFRYTVGVPVDLFPTVGPTPPLPSPVTLNAVPGFETVRLPLRDEFMPTAFAWKPDGTLILASLKGRIWTIRDTDDDGLEDEQRAISDELAAPYGLAASDNHIDVVNKYGLLRLFDEDGDSHVERMTTIASGWGHTTDYHDWAVGLPQDADGNYYMALPCQQDKRNKVAANLRGSVLKLVPREPTEDDPRLFAIETLTGGHRFPMGIARNRAGEMFVTDNQGNYNPFNELNHIVPGKRFGFINVVDRTPDFKPPLTPPAIDIPHPWTRSVNGICFLETPTGGDQKRDRAFGPFEGHLIGCEYDTRRLIRMSLQKVGDTYQGAAYAFSYDAPTSGPPFLGPLVCAVSPQGDLYVGGIRDSGWGGANNIGEIVRLRPDFDRLPCGISEVRATADGFTIDFTSPIHRENASKLESYAVSSYTRISTPAYGGDDHDRRQEKLKAVTVSEDARRATITLGEMRAGFVYELRLKNLARGRAELFPAEAHYTLRVVPE